MNRFWPQVGLALMLAGCALLLTLAVVSGEAQAQEEGVVYVALDGVCGGMQPCYAHPQDAVDASHAGDTIKLAHGRYTGVSVRPAPPGYPHPPANGLIAQVVYLSKTITLRGGYTTADWVDCDPAANPTTLDAEGLGRAYFIAGPPASSSRQTPSPELEGMRITGGDAHRLGGHLWGNVGGGGYVIGARVRIIRNEVTGNVADYGGGLYLERCNATLSDNAISLNIGSMRGGGLGLYESRATLSGNAILSNTAISGGGLYLHKSDAVLDDNTVSGNATDEYGGAVYMLLSNAALHGNTLSRNAAFLGGGLHLHDSDATLQNDVIVDNQADGSGSGISVRHGSTARLRQNTIARNTGGDGSGVCVTGSSPRSTVALTNTILASQELGISVASGNMVTLEGTLWYDIAEQTSGEGAILIDAVRASGDPAFVDPDNGGYRIGLGSAPLDRGIDAEGRAELDHQPRPHRAPGVGADEYRPTDVLERVFLPVVRRDHLMLDQGRGAESPVHAVQRGETLSSIARRYGTSVNAVMRVNDLTNPNLIWVGQRLHVPGGSVAADGIGKGEGSAHDATGRWIEVVLSSQRTIAWQGDRQARAMVVSTGISRYPTPPGRFRVYAKYPSVTMSGPGYHLPGVPDTMFFHRGYAIHGTYWHENFGQPMSHGCVNLTKADAAWLYQWAPLGTPVVVRH
jgi:lipoprotein-anchoring transpeptidase ErfK/SrfK